MLNVDKTATASVDDDTLTELIPAVAGKELVLTMLNFTNSQSSNDYVDVYFGAVLKFEHISMVAELGSGNIISGRGVLVPRGTSVSFQVANGGATVYANATYCER